MNPLLSLVGGWSGRPQPEQAIEGSGHVVDLPVGDSAARAHP